MKKLLPSLLIAAAMIGFSMSANAQDDATASTTTDATIITPIAITSVNSLNFGDIVGTANGGTVTVAPNNNRTSSATDLIIDGTPGTVSAASFKVTGQDGYTYAITLPAAFDVVHATEATAIMGVSGFTSAPDATGAIGTVTAGEEIVTVGATLSVGTNQTPGVYSHANGLSITVQYN